MGNSGGHVPLVPPFARPQYYFLDYRPMSVSLRFFEVELT